MKLLLGVDGGGTKTAFLLTDQTGRTLAEDTAPGSSYKQIGIDPVAKQLLSGAKRCLDAAGAPWEALAGVCLGLPCLGESAEGDSALLTSLRRAFSTVALLNVNDAEVGFSGSLAGDEGVNIVAGTGSIAFGRNSRGETARCGGWSEFFGDEGSCYWAGRRTMELFSKEADGRLPKNALYEIIRMEFSLAEDFAFIDLMERAFLSSRRKVASLQPLLERAARAGDAAAAEIYRQEASPSPIPADSSRRAT